MVPGCLALLGCLVAWALVFFSGGAKHEQKVWEDLCHARGASICGGLNVEDQVGVF
jgi:hypothetical protein